MASKALFSLGFTDVMRWEDTIKVNAYSISLSELVELGIAHNLELALKLKKDLQSKRGLLIAFPITMLIDELQHIVGNDDLLSKLVKLTPEVRNSQRSSIILAQRSPE